MASATLLAQRFPAAAPVQRLAAVGRMALTNYFAQSIIMTAIFYGPGALRRTRAPPLPSHPGRRLGRRALVEQTLALPLPLRPRRVALAPPHLRPPHRSPD